MTVSKARVITGATSQLVRIQKKKIKPISCIYLSRLRMPSANILLGHLVVNSIGNFSNFSFGQLARIEASLKFEMSCSDI